MKTAIVRLIGGVIGGGGGVGGVFLTHAAFDESLGIGFAALGGALAVTVLAYILASALKDDGSEALRGAMIGMNAGANAAIWLVLGVPILAGITGALVALSLSNTISSAGAYQAVIGWANWVLPMSWLIIALGFLFLALCVLGVLLTFGQVDYCKLHKFFVDWPTGTLFVKGGWVANFNTVDTAFNMGTFAFIDKNSADDHTNHESGHTLNLATFGSFFHLIGFIDEMVIGRGHNAYSERLADSHDNAGPSNILMWT